MKRRTLLLVNVMFCSCLVAACLNDTRSGGENMEIAEAALTSPGSLGLRLRTVIQQSPAASASGLQRANPHSRHALSLEDGALRADVLMQLDGPLAHASQTALDALGVEIRTVTPSGIATASIRLDRARAAVNVAGVQHIELASRVHTTNDESQESGGLNIPGEFPIDAPTGSGVIVGVIDTGLDYTHPDFLNPDGTSRVLALWDQSDTADFRPPAGKEYGTTYTNAQLNDCLLGTGYCVTDDIDGHGTHVAGTAAGNGEAYGTGSARHQYAGGAPDADIVIVRFDFDGDRNSTASIVDGVDWIFQQSAAAGLPAVINMSLGTDYGPHDGTTLEETGITDLTGEGRLVVVAAGNAGRTGLPENADLWGLPIHGSGTASDGNCSDITVDIQADYVPTDPAEEANYVFFDIWYDGTDELRVQVETPSGALYPPDFTRRNRNTWTTGSNVAAYSTSEGYILVGNGGDQLEWGAANGDHELYVEISDTDSGTTPATGTWRICVYGTNIQSSGEYHGWHGASGSLALTPVAYEGNGTDNVMTVGSPATADGVIAVGAYTTRMGWESWDPFTDTRSCSTYNVGPLSYYDPYYIDSDGDGAFTHDFGGDCYYDPDLGDTAEPFDHLAFFSSRGPRRDGAYKPEIASPGVGIISSLSQTVLADEVAAGGGYFTNTNRVHADGLHAVLQGTSMACPNATGAVALLLQADPSLTPADARLALTSTARSDATTGSTPNADWGYGRIDVTAALGTLTCTLDSDCDDSDPCTTDACDAGACSNTVLADESSCGGPNLCCGGLCFATECDVNADCGGGDACHSPVCVDGGSCTSECQLVEPACINADGCCPTGCDAGNDDDCGGGQCVAYLGDSCSSNEECCEGRCRGGRNKRCK